MAEYSLKDAWWLKQAEPDNPLPALKLGVDIAQHRAEMQIKQGQLANEIARTDILKKTADAKLKIQHDLEAGNADLAQTIAGIDDWTDPEQQSRFYEAAARNPMTVGGKAYLGGEYMMRNAAQAKRLQADVESKIQAREERTIYNQMVEERRGLLAQKSSELTDKRIEEIDQRLAMADRGMSLKEKNYDLAVKKFELSQLLADHNIPLTDAKVLEKQKQIAGMEREAALKERQQATRERALDIQERKLGGASALDQGKWSNSDLAEFNQRSAVIKAAKLDPEEATFKIRELRFEIASRVRRQRELQGKKAGATAAEKLGPPINAAPATAPGMTPDELQKFTEEYNKLKPGEQYIDPKGVPRIKGE